MNNIIGKIDTLIRWSFYILFFLVPLVMWPTTFELFEFNKMWLVFGFSIFIAFLWGSKIIIEKRIEIRRTPLDIPIALFLVSQIISTIFSMDPHVSIWGYYSRFNGGLFSTISYVFLYYAFATNLTQTHDQTGIQAQSQKPISYKLLAISLLSGLAVTLWGLPSHFGLDPTCLVFRGTFDTSCWTNDFQPTVRIFSTLGQPNWMGTYLAALIPIALGSGLMNLKQKTQNLKPILFLVLCFMFYAALLYTRSQSSFLGLIVGLIMFFVVIIFKNFDEIKLGVIKNRFSKYLIAAIIIFAITTFFLESPIQSLNKYTTFSGIKTILTTQKSVPQTVSKPKPAAGLENDTNIQIGGSQSSQIRLIVWKGAIELFRLHPLFGTGVETFAYAYYQVKPVEHNLTSEWDFLYNKAHNEYLNYLATTGAFGLLTYLSIIAVFYGFAFKLLFKKREEGGYFLISLGILGGYTAILVSNFFGFSVVVINLFFFIFPILFFDLENGKSSSSVFVFPNRPKIDESSPLIAPPQTIIIVILGIIALYYEFFLLNFWGADQRYALGYNLDKASQYVQAYTPLTDAVKMLPSEDLYKDELSINMATLSLLLADQKQSTQAAQFGEQAKALSDAVISAHPNNIVFYKTRARVAFALSEIDPAFLDLALLTIEQAKKLAPTDAKLVYNEGLFYNQKGDQNSAIRYLDEAIKLKPNYGDAYYSLALVYSTLAKKGGPNALSYKEREKSALEYILTHIDPTNTSAKELLKSIE